MSKETKDYRKAFIIQDPRNDYKWYGINSEGSLINEEAWTFNKIRTRLRHHLDYSSTPKSKADGDALLEFAEKHNLFVIEIEIEKMPFKNHHSKKATRVYKAKINNHKIKTDSLTICDIFEQCLVGWARQFNPFYASRGC